MRVTFEIKSLHPMPNDEVRRTVYSRLKHIGNVHKDSPRERYTVEFTDEEVGGMPVFLHRVEIYLDKNSYQ